ncbi:MAG: hypothetical protein ACPL28_07360 [bacterium]
MTKKQLQREWERLKFEIFVNKPQTDKPYSQHIVRRREFLLFAEVHLNNIFLAKAKRDRWDEKFETEMYNKVMELYYNWSQK